MTRWARERELGLGRRGIGAAQMLLVDWLLLLRRSTCPNSKFINIPKLEVIGSSSNQNINAGTNCA